MAKFTREELEAKLAAGERSLQRANLTAADLSGAKYDTQTKWPEDFDPEAAGALKT